jgi:antibiotic biosynthesis monooxygenase (ABM) superfamily enzyme
MNGRYLLVVSLWLRTNDIAAFEAFERQAAKVMAAYDGRIERAIRISGDGDDGGKPFEVHIVSFPDEFAFQMYRQSLESITLAVARENVISRTVIHPGKEVNAYP